MRVGDRHTRLESRDAVVGERRRRRIHGIELDREPDLRRRRRKSETRRHDADDLAPDAVDAEGASDDSLVGPKVSPPERISDDGHRWSAGAILLFCEQAPARRGHPEDVKEARRHVGRRDALGGNGRVLVAEVDRVLLVDADAVDGVCLGAVGPERARGLEGVVERDERKVVPCADEPLGMWEGQRPHENGVDHGEDRDRRTESRAEGDEGGEGERGRSA